MERRRWRAGSRPRSSDRRGNRDIWGSRYYTATPTGHLFRLPSLLISRLRISRLRSVGLRIPRLLGIPRPRRSSGLWISGLHAARLWISELLGIPRLLRFSGLWIPRLFGSARFPRSSGLWISRLLGIPRRLRASGIWILEPPVLFSLLPPIESAEQFLGAKSQPRELVRALGRRITADPRNRRPRPYCGRPNSAFAPGRAIRGGIPITFPWFGANRHAPAAPHHSYNVSAATISRLTP